MTARCDPTGRATATVVDTFVAEAEAALREGELREGEPHEDDRVRTDLLLVAEPVRPSSALRARLLDALETTNRFDDLEERVAVLADVSIDRARDLLRGVDVESAWTPGPGPGVEILHFEGGERVRDAVTGFVRLGPGAAFPDHGHVGDENVLVLSGVLETSDGERFAGGELAQMPAGSHHAFRSVGRARLVLMTIVQGGVILDGEVVGPGDPRG